MALSKSRARLIGSLLIYCFTIIPLDLVGLTGVALAGTPIRIHMGDAIVHAYEEKPIAVPIILDADSIAVSRLDFLITISDPAAIAFIGARPGTLLKTSGWQSFKYQVLPDTNTSGQRADSIVRITAVANAGQISSPPPKLMLKSDTLLTMWFKPSIDLKYAETCPLVRFLWKACDDNTLTNANGDTTYVEQEIRNSWSGTIWNEFDDINYPDSIRPPGVGIADSCLSAVPPSAIERRVIFGENAVCLSYFVYTETCGDIDLNGICPEIGDALVFRNYFIYGLDAFDPNHNLRTVQILATNINNDGQPLTLADFLMLVRRISGDPNWYVPPKPVAAPNRAALNWRIDGTNVIINWDSRVDAGGLHFVFDHNSGNFGPPLLANTADGMQVVSHDDGRQLRLLVYSFEAGEKIPPSEGTLLTIPILSPTKGLRLSSVEAAGYWGESIDVTAAESRAVPVGFALQQNVPNPFNAGTTVNFTLPEAGHATITVYDILGRTVATLIDGPLDAGSHTIEWDARDARGRELASGVYFYRLSSAGAQECRKMVLQK